MRWAQAHLDGTHRPEADDPRRHHQRLQYPAGSSKIWHGDAVMQWWPQRQPKDLPLLSRLLAAAAPVFGGPEWAGQMMVPVLSTLFMFPLFLYMRHLGQPAAGLLGGWVAAFSPVYFARTVGRPNEVQTKVLGSRGVKTIVAETTDQTESLCLFLESLRARADAIGSTKISTRRRK